MLQWLGTLFERIVGLAGAALFSQAPHFMMQYTHQMAGHVAELQRQVAAMTHVALQGGKSLETFIEKFLTSQDVDFRAQGQLMERMVERFSRLSEGLRSLQEAQIWERPYLFLKHLDTGVARDTIDAFEPGFSITLEGGIYALSGMLITMGLFRLVRAGVRKAFVKPSPA